MTKKFIVSLESGKCKSEFLVPDYYGNESKFVGLETGKKYDVGLVVFTGVILNSKTVFDRYKRIQRIGYFNSFKVKKNLNIYLTEIKNHKIGSKVILDESTKKLIKKME